MRGSTDTDHRGRYTATALVFAGGRNRRMGRDKAFIPVRGMPLIEKILSQLKPRFSEILLCVSDAERYRRLGVPLVVDEKPSRGPLGALMSGLRASRNEVSFAVACDIPEIDPAFLDHMFGFVGDYDIVVPTTGFGKYEPCFALYKKSLIPVIEDLLDRERCKMNLLFSLCRTRCVRIPDDSWYFNLNREEDLKRYENHMAEKEQHERSIGSGAPSSSVIKEHCFRPGSLIPPAYNNR